jgi:trigger factor
MNITKEDIDSLNATLKIRIGEEDYNERVEQVLKDYRKKVTMNGFRPGKVPAGLVRKMYRTPVLVEEINKLVSESVSNYLKEEGIKILGDPLPSEKGQQNIDWENQRDFEFDFDLGLAPQLEINLSQKDKIPLYEIQVDRKMIEDTKESYAGRMGQMIPMERVEGSENLKGDFQQIDKEGNPIEEGIRCEDAYFSLEVLKDEKTRTAFMARQAGESVDLDIRRSFPNETEIASLLKIDKSAVPEIAPDFRFTIKEIAKFRKAEFNQELFDRLYGKDEVKTMEEFEERISEELNKGLARDSEYRFTIDVKEALIKKYKFDLPVEFLKRWLVVVNKDKFTAEQIEEDFPKYEDDLKWQLIRDQIVRDQEIKVEAYEIRAAAREMALMQYRQYGMMNVPEENLENYASDMLKNEDERKKIAERILERKVMDLIRSEVKLDNKQITLEKFNKLFENN